MKGPTKRQGEVLTFIADYIRAHSYPPTIRELAEYFSISVKGAHDHVTALRKKGLLKAGDKKSRTMEVVGVSFGGEEFEEVPILGTVAAGRPITAEENREGTMRLHPSILKKGSEYFILKIRGDSMINAGILDGDLALIEQKPAVNSGEIAVVMLDDAMTLKTFYRENHRVRLQPENPKYSPIYCSGDSDIRILGRLARIFRSYDDDANPAAVKSVGA